MTDPLLDRFFNNASDSVRGEALGYVGRSLRDADRPIPADVIEGVKVLWEWRVEASRQPEAGVHIDEMAAFGWWFASGEPDEAWALDQLEASLSIAGKADVDHGVVERLAALAPK